jgi:hypothetical protein
MIMVGVGLGPDVGVTVLGVISGLGVAVALYATTPPAKDKPIMIAINKPQAIRIYFVNQ